MEKELPEGGVEGMVPTQFSDIVEKDQINSEKEMKNCMMNVNPTDNRKVNSMFKVFGNIKTTTQSLGLITFQCFKKNEFLEHD